MKKSFTLLSSISVVILNSLIIFINLANFQRTSPNDLSLNDQLLLYLVVSLLNLNFKQHFLKMFARFIPHFVLSFQFLMVAVTSSQFIIHNHSHNFYLKELLYSNSCLIVVNELMH